MSGRDTNQARALMKYSSPRTNAHGPTQTRLPERARARMSLCALSLMCILAGHASETCAGGTIAVAQPQATPKTAAGLPKFMSGSWCGGDAQNNQEETWSAPRGGVMLGTHRDLREGKLIGFEFMRIARHPDGTQLHAQPGGRAATVFVATKQDEQRIVFENHKHDYPKRIHYTRSDAHTLIVKIDGGEKDAKPMQWTWKDRCAWLKVD